MLEHIHGCECQVSVIIDLTYKSACPTVCLLKTSYYLKQSSIYKELVFPHYCSFHVFLSQPCEVRVPLPFMEQYIQVVRDQACSKFPSPGKGKVWNLSKDPRPAPLCHSGVSPFINMVGPFCDIFMQRMLVSVLIVFHTYDGIDGVLVVHL